MSELSLSIINLGFVLIIGVTLFMIVYELRKP